MSRNHIAQYYDQTQHHYDRWWNLKEDMSLHYGLWFQDTKSFSEALKNTNKTLAELANIGSDQHVLDAGCGVAGSSIFLVNNFKVKVTGITLSDKQIQRGRQNVASSELGDSINLIKMDYTATEFKDNSFDVVWACESSSSCENKEAFTSEMLRVLKPGGRLVLSDFFRNEGIDQDNELVTKWCSSWAMASLPTRAELINTFEQQGFQSLKSLDLTREVFPTVKRLYRGFILGSIPSIIYNLLFGASKYSRGHYLSGKYQYEAYKKGLWSYHAMVFLKP